MLSLAKNLTQLRNLRKLGLSQVYKLYTSSSALNYLNFQKYAFSTEQKKPEEEEGESHDDFKPKSKVQINEENVFQQIDDVLIPYNQFSIFSGLKITNASFL